MQQLSADHLVDALRAAGEPSRLRLLALLAISGDLTVKDLTEILAQSQPRISQHLKRLTEAGLIERIPEGAWAYYSIARQGAAGNLARAILDRLGPADPVLERDRARLDEVKSAHRAAADRYFADHAADWNQLRALHAPERQVEQAILDLLGLDPVQAVLDVGTGTGRILQLLHPLYARALGLDLSHDMLSIARRTLDEAGLSKAQVRLGDVFDLGAVQKTYDLVIIHQVLHYLDDPARAIREAARALTPGGRLLVVDFAPHDIEPLREVHAHRRLGFSHDQMCQWLLAAGLEMRTISDLHPEPNANERLTVTFWLSANSHPEHHSEKWKPIFGQSDA